MISTTTISSMSVNPSSTVPSLPCSRLGSSAFHAPTLSCRIGIDIDRTSLSDAGVDRAKRPGANRPGPLVARVAWISYQPLALNVAGPGSGAARATVPSARRPWRTSYRCRQHPSCPGCRSTCPTSTAPRRSRPWRSAPLDAHRLRVRRRSSRRKTNDGSSACSAAATARHVAVLVGEHGLRRGQRVPEARLSRSVVRLGACTQEGRDGDGDQNGNNQHHNHELDEGEPLFVLPTIPDGLEHRLHRIPPWVGCLNRQSTCVDSPESVSAVRFRP